MSQMSIPEILMYYYSILFIASSIFAAIYYSNSNNKNKKNKGYPWNFLRTLFVLGAALLTGAITLSILAKI